jgi:hypothetical protein
VARIVHWHSTGLLCVATAPGSPDVEGVGAMPNEVMFFGASLLAIAVLATFLTTALVRWGQSPLPTFTGTRRRWSRLKRLLQSTRVAA